VTSAPGAVITDVIKLLRVEKFTIFILNTYYMRLKLLVLVCFCCTGLLAQDIATSPRLAAGLSYGFGKEAENSDYTYSNRYIQAQLYYSFNPGKQWEYLAALQPEVNFARHQLLNLYFVKPDEPGYERKREEFTKLKEVREYIINVAFCAAQPDKKF
jgi:hypothetical protein